MSATCPHQPGKPAVSAIAAAGLVWLLAGGLPGPAHAQETGAQETNTQETNTGSIATIETIAYQPIPPGTILK